VSFRHPNNLRLSAKNAARCERFVSVVSCFENRSTGGSGALQ
jgi:hypothetical protein